MFWDDTPPPKPPKAQKEKRTPPERTWERPDYLPGLEEAQRFPVELLTDAELVSECVKGNEFVVDTECYPNYWLAAFTSAKTNKVVYFELSDTVNLDVHKLRWVMESFCTVGFNSLKYDLPMIALALNGLSTDTLHQASTKLIVEEARAADVLRSFKTKALKVNHIDIFEVCPGVNAGLKTYAGRIHAPRMQDLPFRPGTILSSPQIDITRWYCINDIRNTQQLYGELQEQIALRRDMTQQYGVDLRSKSDAQIAEAVLTHELEKVLRTRIRPPVILTGTTYRYKTPHFIQFQSPLMQWALQVVQDAIFIVSEKGNIGLPPQLSDLEIHLAGGVYRMGVGGLHSSEKTVAHFAADGYELYDKDVTSYYPRIILNQRLFPSHLGPGFLDAYGNIVETRIRAKQAGDKVTADSLKITVNGSFGKLGSMYSNLYAPDLLIQTTLTGQLSLLMLIERLELEAIHVVSANTDGIVIKPHRTQVERMKAIVRQWEVDTGFETEETRYRALYSKDVNNYIAVKEKGDPKRKGIYAPTGLSKNPTNAVCMDAVIALLNDNVPIEQTVRGCTDIRKFVSVRYVKGGAVKDGEYFGKVVRWYYDTGRSGEIVYASSGNKVPRTEGASPLLVLPDRLPQDIDFDWYIAEASRILVDIGHTPAS